jgi:hypothetical protein
MKRFLIFFLLLSLMAACSNNAVEDDAPMLSGPSLVMFYTDN